MLIDVMRLCVGEKHFVLIMDYAIHVVVFHLHL